MELGQIIYEGPSVLDGEPIVAVAAYNSRNTKTGPMIQLWIMHAEEAPNVAAKSGKDASVCGDCSHRHHTGGDCYVVLAHGPLGVWKAYKRGRYLKATEESLGMFVGKSIRLGAYGDPAAVPFEALHSLVKHARMVTGYTHQIGHANFDSRVLRYCMVSTESANATQAHQRHGRRTFRVKAPGEPVLKGEVLCPATTMDHYQCIRCGICDGAHQKGKSVVVDAHGARSKTKYRDRIPIAEVANE